MTISNDAGFPIRLKKSVFNVTSKAIQAICMNYFQNYSWDSIDTF